VVALMDDKECTDDKECMKTPVIVGQFWGGHQKNLDPDISFATPMELVIRDVEDYLKCDVTNIKKLE
jgi:hypothetical protein